MTPEQQGAILKHIGPIRQTLKADSFGRGCILLCTVAGVVLVGTCLMSWATPILLGLAPLFLFSLARVTAEPLDRLLVGERGLAEVRGGEVTYLLWAELGVTWRPLPLAFDKVLEVDPIVLLLEREDGTRFRLRAHYPGVHAVQRLIGRYLSRQQSQREAPAPRAATDEQRVTAEGPAPGLFGPWTGSDIDRAIGPVRQVHPPRQDVVEQVRRQMWLPFVVGLVISTVVLLVNVAVANFARYGGLDLIPGVSMALGGYGLSVLYKDYWLNLLRSVLLVGERGVAIWHPDRSLIVKWDDLGNYWDVDQDSPAGARGEVGATILLKLRHIEGASFSITDLYENALLVVARVSEELQRFRPVDRPRGDLRQRGPASENIRAPAHFSETPPLPSVPPVQRETSAPDTVEFICAPWPGVGCPEGVLLTAMLLCSSAVLVALGSVGCGILVWLPLAFASVLSRIGRENTGRWLVGTAGLTYQDATRTEVLRWDNLGTGWRVFFLDQGAHVPPRLVFLLPDGTELSVPSHYEGAEQLAARVRAELARRLERPAPEEP
jgi:hypothetical protein